MNPTIRSSLLQCTQSHVAQLSNVVRALVNQLITPFFISWRGTNHINTYYEWCGKYAFNVELYHKESNSNGNKGKVYFYTIKLPQCK